MAKRLSIDEIVEKKSKEKISVITAYDYPTALIADRAGIDVILVGDSGGMVVLGYDSTVPVTMDEMMLFTRAVSRGVRRALIVTDMPFLSYQVSKEEAIRNAGKLIKDGGANAVKLEGGKEFRDTVAALVNAGIPVMGHIGMTPQTASFATGYRLQGKTHQSAKRIIDDGRSLEEVGAFSIVLEMVTEEAAEIVTKICRIPTIGIGSGRNCDGQVLVLHDLLGLYDKFVPKFAKQYANLSPMIQKAVEHYREDVLSRRFPAEEHVYHMDQDELKKLLSTIKLKTS